MATNSLLPDAIRGGVAGALATVAMTAAMVCMHRRLPKRQRYGLPPEHIVNELLERTDADDQLSRRQFKSLSMVVHHGYGTTMGAAYGILAPRVQTPRVLSGVCFGMAVWVVGYLGWLPALRMDASATREPEQRNALTIAAHLLWGAATGLLTRVPRHNDL